MWTTTMSKARLFVGGLNEKVDRDALGSRLSHYGSVSGIEIKEKTDFDGNVVFRFSYVNLEAPQSQIEECINHLNGASWQGSRLRVEIAKESFLDRLNRERAASQQQPPTHSEKIDKLPVVSTVKSPKAVKENDGETDSKRPQKDSEAEDNTHLDKKKKKKKEKSLNNGSIEDETSVTEYVGKMSESSREKKKKREREEESFETEPPAIAEYKSKKKNKSEEKMMSSFKKFSSVWADSDSENTDDGEADGVHVGDVMGNGGDQGIHTNQKPAKVSSVMSATVHKTPKSKKINGVGDDNDSDATIDDDDDADIVQDFSDVRDEQQAQLKILANLEGPGRGSTKSKIEGSAPAIKPITRYDPTLTSHQQFRISVQPSSQKQEVKGSEKSDPSGESKYVKVAKDLTFGQSSSGFSLLAQFSEQRKETREEIESEEEVIAPIVAPSKLITAQQHTKKKPFFIQPYDEKIEAAISWMVQSLTEEVRSEFAEVQPQLRHLYKTRAVRANKEKRKLSSRSHQMLKRKRGTGSRNPYRDERWRERGLKK
ncbi:probable RNA-binding protein CG14230 [Homarus americanus]|uniref:probable RNA-binding protein CG14230 n=1 Tax=Homarus americanus TaxID=6706 RepID=UPI001C4446D7|nr:probable RNA-binding protein CG14230 [Homarus americanus]